MPLKWLLSMNLERCVTNKYAAFKSILHTIKLNTKRTETSCLSASYKLSAFLRSMMPKRSFPLIEKSGISLMIKMPLKKALGGPFINKLN